jgi:hypothetical protein
MFMTGPCQRTSRTAGAGTTGDVDVDPDADPAPALGAVDTVGVGRMGAG